MTKSDLLKLIAHLPGDTEFFFSIWPTDNNKPAYMARTVELKRSLTGRLILRGQEI